MTFTELVDQVREEFCKADVSSISGGFLAVQFNLTGEGGGVFYVEVKDGRISVEPYDYHDRNAALTLSVDNFMKLAMGKLDPVAAFTVGKLKVEGDMGKALEIKQLIPRK